MDRKRIRTNLSSLGFGHKEVTSSFADHRFVTERNECPTYKHRHSEIPSIYVPNSYVGELAASSNIRR